MSDPDLSDMERFYIASYLLFPKECPEPQEAAKAIEWFMTEFNHDNYQQKKTKILSWTGIWTSGEYMQPSATSII